MVVNKFAEGCDWLFYLMRLNVLWLRYSLFGGVFFSLIPATVTVYDCLRKLMVEQNASQVSIMYRTYYRCNRPRYKQTSIYVFLMIVVILFMFKFLGTYPSPPFLFEFTLRSHLFLWLLLSIVFFPVHAYFRLSAAKMFLQPLAFIFICPIQTIGSVLIIGLTLTVYQLFPLMGICLGIALPAYGISHLFFKKFIDMQERFF
ncbi:MAG TPA: hypothetical protein DEQ24_08850 [Enterococcus sp.]|uniref:DUF624 domain-containing protein n=1 Tax=Enterococcus sp. TaxID=35783 RepID=UPI000ED5B560|nr:DUF624 domain-containing protein [Enterococcus sp.]HCE12834.1 hypothetical protein [Enterococcus sp.]